MTERTQLRRPKVVQASIVHPARDTRVFMRECRSLAASGYDVTLYARSPEAFDEDGVRVIPVAEPKGRVARMTVGVWGMLRPLLRERADLYHFHDPELIPLGIVMRTLGRTVIYDAHEDLPSQVIDKVWIPSGLRPAIGFASRFLVRLAGHGLSAIVTATKKIATSYPSAKTVVVNNYPLILDGGPTIPYADRPGGMIYVGGIADIRGFSAMVEIAKIVHEARGVRLMLVGGFMPAALEKKLSEPGVEECVDYRGQLPVPESRRLMSEAKVGLVLYGKTAANVDAQPNKMFEYMAEGIPVVGSNFALWEEIIQGSGVGLVAPPDDPQTAAKAVLAILDDPETAAAMADRGRKAVAEEFSWEAELRKLLDLYGRLIPTRPVRR